MAIKGSVPNGTLLLPILSFFAPIKRNFKGGKTAAQRLEKLFFQDFFHKLVTFTKEEPVSTAAGFKS